MKRFRDCILPVCFSLLFCFQASPQDHIFVKHDASGNNDGTSWADAYTSLETALSAAVSGKHIWAAAGTYEPENEVGGTGARFRAFQLKNGVSVYGGFAGTEDPATFDLNDRDFHTDETILSGAADDVYHIFRHVNLGLDITAVLDGFTIAGGNADGSDPDNKGGGILNSGSSAGNGSSPTIRNCLFRDNRAAQGGAIYNSCYSSPVISVTRFLDNTADVGGAVYIISNNTSFENCFFENNSAEATGAGNGGGAIYITTSVDNSKVEIIRSFFEQNSAEYGGAIYSHQHETIVKSCYIRGNEAQEHGGGFYSTGAKSQIFNSLVSGNKSGGDGGGAFFDDQDGSGIINTTIVGNYAVNGGGISVTGGSTVDIKNTIVWGNAAGTQGNLMWLSGDSTVNTDHSLYSVHSDDVHIESGGTLNTSGDCLTDDDPEFLNPLAPTSENTPNILGNYFFCGCAPSPLIDAGDNALVPGSVTEDLRGAPRLMDGNDDGTATVDMGAYEFDPAGCSALEPFEGDGSEEHPYEISMLQHLYWIAVDPNRWGYHYIQTADIDACMTEHWYGGDGWSPIGNSNIRFTGSYDGQGYSISNLSIHRPNVREVGLFGEIGGQSGSNVVLKNITLLNADVTAERQVGALVGRAQQYNTITNCRVSGKVEGTRNVGGLVGHGIRTDFLHCSSSAAVSPIGSHAMYHGGLIGHINNASTVKECFASGSVEGRSRVGGLIGAMGWNSSVEDSYALGAVSSEGISAPMIGGLVGEVWNAGIRRSFSTGYVEISGLNADYGGLVGTKVTDSNFFDENNFWDIETSGLETSELGSGKTTAEMMTRSTFTDAGWDFSETGDWWMVDGGTRPFLRMEWSTVINNSHQLQMMAMDLDEDYVLMSNIDLTPYMNNPAGMWGTDAANAEGAGWVPIGSGNTFPFTAGGGFTGTLDGNGHTISGLFINRTTVKDLPVGLFGDCTDGARIENLGLIDVDVTGDAYVGGLAGYVGSGDRSEIRRCYSTGSVAGRFGVGGFIGVADNNALIEECYSRADVAGKNTTHGAHQRIGGFIGTMQTHPDGSPVSEIRNCYAGGSVTSVGFAWGHHSGGFVGRNYRSKVINSYAKGLIDIDFHPDDSDKNGGGFTGSVSGQSGYEDSGNFFDILSTGQTTTAGNATGKTTAEMMTRSTFTDAGWDFTNIWGINEGVSYPYLIPDAPVPTPTPTPPPGPTPTPSFEDWIAGYDVGEQDGREDDPDGDGWTNYDEYRFHILMTGRESDPTDPLSGGQAIPLHRGWNLVSYTVNTAWYRGDEPPGLLEGVVKVGLDDWADFFNQSRFRDSAEHFIAAQVRHPDGEWRYYGQFQPDWRNTLDYISPDEGLWLNMAEPDVFVVQGTGDGAKRVPPGVGGGYPAITLKPGWNLVGVLSRSLFYTEGFPHDAAGPSDLGSSKGYPDVPGMLRAAFGLDATEFGYISVIQMMYPPPYLVRVYDASIPWQAWSLKFVQPGTAAWIRLTDTAPELELIYRD